ncbi:Acetyl-coenzyme A synthetase [Candidatus Paraburkholderia kirkii]|nr:Acetyl-coenzyme A synthetase [Candidatus Paraburkholderia kirkii]
MATGRVAEAAAIGVPDTVKGETVGLVVTLMPDIEPGAEVAKVLSDAVVTGLGKAFRPSDVLFVDDLPKTRNMKIMRRAVRAAWLCLSAGDLSSLANPEALGAITRRANELGLSSARDRA